MNQISKTKHELYWLIDEVLTPDERIKYLEHMYYCAYINEEDISISECLNHALYCSETDVIMSRLMHLGYEIFAFDKRKPKDLLEAGEIDSIDEYMRYMRDLYDDGDGSFSPEFMDSTMYSDLFVLFQRHRIFFVNENDTFYNCPKHYVW